MVTCLACATILTIVNVEKNIKKEKSVMTWFDCHNCGAKMCVSQELTKEPSKSYKKASNKT